ncbi:Rab-like protein 3 [Mortierella polycephala]|uniref:Rab-like protein 3 n=1 Tax=Mortierella polycephala TaxID=41804 RepID=A0A9P6QGX6_9FUNG|nr:Rab-like protein 3 [Mortierella polycephala]
MLSHFTSSPDFDATAKVLVLGDSGVGKSSLVHILCHNEPVRSSTPTIGCNVDVRLHSSSIPSAAATSSARSAIPSLLSRSNPPSDPSISTAGPGSTFIEFYDISGSPAGIILVHDLCNRRSYDNLWKWIGDYLEASRSAPGSFSGDQRYDAEFDQPRYSGGQYGELDIPLLVVGTKQDMAMNYDQQRGGSATFGQDLVQKYGGEAISVCSISPAEFMPNSSTSIAFNMFFNRVVDPRAARSWTPSGKGGYAAATHSHTYPRPPPTPTPGPGPGPRPEQPQYQNSVPSDDTDNGSSSIPIMDFATFTGGSAVDASNLNRSLGQQTPPRAGSPLGQSPSPVGSVTPTGTKSALRAQYERNRSVLNQYSNMGVPVYTSSRPGSSTGAR